MNYNPKLNPNESPYRNSNRFSYPNRSLLRFSLFWYRERAHGTHNNMLQFDYRVFYSHGV